MNLSGATDLGVWVLIAVLLLPATKILVDWIRPARAHRIEQPLNTKIVTDAASMADLRRLEEKILTREVFEGYRAERSRDLTRIEAAIDALVKAMGDSNASQYKARRALHAKVNAHDAALWFLAGQLSERDAGKGMRMQELLSRAEKEMQSDD